MRTIYTLTKGWQGELTNEIFELYEDQEILSYGTFDDNRDGTNIMGEGECLRFVAVKGYGDDWAIYVGKRNNSNEEVASTGDKITSERAVKLLVPCTDEAFLKYRAE